MVWTDTIQTIVMVAGSLIVIVVGTINVGGLSVVWERAQQSGRIEFFK